MYTENDFSDVLKTQKNMRVLTIAAAVVLLVPVVLSFVFRLTWLGYVAGFLLSTAIMVLSYLVLLPIRWYRKHLNDIKVARKRETDVEIVSFGDKMLFREKLDMFEVRCIDIGNDSCDRLLYWDARKTPPQVKPGDRLHVTTYDYYIVDYAIL